MTRAGSTRALFIPVLMLCMSAPLYTTTNAVNRLPHGANGNFAGGDFMHLTPRPPVLVANGHFTNLADPADSDNQDPASADFLCYNDKTSVVIRDVPCPAESSDKVEVTSQLLNLFFKFEGGIIFNPAVSSVVPDHLMDFNLSDIESADWMNYNKSDLGIRLQKLSQQLAENNNELLNQLLQYLSSESLRNITTLSYLLLDVMNSTSYLNMCTNTTNIDSLTEDIFCDQLQVETETLNYLNLQAQKLLASEGNSTNITSTNIGAIDTSDNNSMSSNITDVFLDVLIQRLQRIKADSKMLAEFYTKLLSAINDFRSVVLKIVKKFLNSLLGSGLSEISDEIINVMFDVRISIGGEFSDDIFNSLLTFTPDTETTRDTSSVDSGTNEKTSYSLSTQQFTSEKPLQRSSTEGSAKPETHRHHTLSDQFFRSETTDSGINVLNTTQDRVQYLKNILEIAVALISSLTELTELLNEGNLLHNVEDEVLTNMTGWHNLRSRTKRETTGYTIAPDRCQRQGNVINQTNFISLCSTCVHTTVLDNTYYPRFLTEKICSGGSSNNPTFRDGCLYQPGILGGRPGGICKQQEFHIIILQRIPGKCMKIISQGQEIITDQWQSTTHALRIGCECVVDQNSQFAKYTHFP